MKTCNRPVLGFLRCLLPLSRECPYLRVVIPTGPSASKRFLQLASRTGGTCSAAVAGPKNIIGSRVWLITGEGTPRTYFLRSWFIVDAALPGTEHGFKTKLMGKKCQVYDPMVMLSEQGWFREFKRRQGNFGLGLQVITDRDARAGMLP
jgi:hypothetical protein